MVGKKEYWEKEGISKQENKGNKRDLKIKETKENEVDNTQFISVNFVIDTNCTIRFSISVIFLRQIVLEPDCLIW